jgi:hypothetical protein
MRFQVLIRAGNTDHILNVRRINITAATEQFVISNRNDTQELIIESNRPFFRNRNMKYRRPEYKIVAGTVKDKRVLDEVFRAILKVLEPPLK